jgi:arylsulfatase A-like enzyme
VLSSPAPSGGSSSPVVRLLSQTLTVAAAWLATLGVTHAARAAGLAPRPPNLIVLLCDNLGYGDIAPFGSTVHRTPELDRMAREGLRLTHLYAASGVCTPSRAALMTGSYPRRVNLHRNARGGAVLQPVEPIGLHPAEETVAELLRERGYATAMIGKWHLGDQAPFLPTRQGFESYLGVPYSDDMTPREGQPWPDLPLLRNEQVIEAPVDRDLLTRREAEAAVRFIQEHRERPFFLYVAHAMPGSTRAPYSSPAFRGRSRHGAWGDAVEELDWAAGQILAAVRELGLAEHTVVLWTSDNGAPRREPVQGSNLPLGGWGYTTSEGGMRVPGIVWAPGRVPAGRDCTELTTLMDILPTFVRLAGGRLPSAPIDGHDVWPLLAGEPGARSPHEAFFYYQGDQLQAVRAGPWKLHLALPARAAGAAGKAAGPRKARLYDVTRDPGEAEDQAAAQPEIVARLQRAAEKAREELGDTERPGRGQRPAGWVAEPRPLRLPAAAR